MTEPDSELKGEPRSPLQLRRFNSVVRSRALPGDTRFRMRSFSGSNTGLGCQNIHQNAVEIFFTHFDRHKRFVAQDGSAL